MAEPSQPPSPSHGRVKNMVQECQKRALEPALFPQIGLLHKALTVNLRCLMKELSAESRDAINEFVDRCGSVASQLSPGDQEFYERTKKALLTETTSVAVALTLISAMSVLCEAAVPDPKPRVVPPPRRRGRPRKRPLPEAPTASAADLNSRNL